MFGFASLAVASLLGTSPPDCAAVRAALPEAGTCVEAASGIVIAADPETAASMLAGATTGAQRFRDAFGREPSRHAVFTFDDPGAVPATSAALRALGFVTVLHLPSDELRQRQLAEAMRRAQAAGGVVQLPAGARRSPPGGGGGIGEPRGGNTVPHELGHLWYANAFWPEPAAASTPGVRRYGSAAPDWLDEAAAMLMEDEAGVESYRRRVADGRSPDPQIAGSIPPEIPLSTLTRMDHPTLASLPPPGAGAGSGPVVLTVPLQPSLFYAQVRVFTDYLIARSGDPRILAVISEGLRDDPSFADWLAGEGGRHGLPTSLDAMQDDWDDWLTVRFGERRPAGVAPPGGPAALNSPPAAR